MDFKQADKATSALEKDYIKVLNEQYKLALSEINAKIAKIYERYGVDGKLDIATMQKMAIKDQKELTRLQKLFSDIDEDLTSLNRGRPQQLAGYSADVYETNAKIVAQKIADVADVSFKLPNRQAVYESAITPLTSIGLQANADAVRTNIQRSITTSIVQGESISKMAKRITIDLETNANNAVRIARTETTRNMGKARLDIFNQAQDLGIKVKKKWLSTKDDRTRHSHAELDGQIRDMDKSFSNGLMFPGDQSGGASEVVNCRCTMITVLPEYE